MAEKQYFVTEEGLASLEKELEYLKSVRRKEVAEKIKVALSFGDLSENSEYDEAKNEQGKLYARIAEVEEILANCVVIEDAHSDDTTMVRLGCRIRVLDKEFDEEEEYEVVGSQEADPMNGRISDDSPFGKALLGKRVGEDVDVDAPAGMMHYRVLKIERA